MTTYKNLFYNAKYDRSKPDYTSAEKPIEYKGFQIFHRIKSSNPSANCFDVVMNGVCIGMYAGLNGAKKYIDGELNPERFSECVERANALIQ